MSPVNEQSEEQQIRRFLLGELSENQRVQLEERLFKDDKYYKQILAIQEELADDYVQNNLPKRQRNAFVQNFLRSSLRTDRVEFAAALSGALGNSRTPVFIEPGAFSWRERFEPLFRPGFRLAFASSTAVLALLIVAWLAVENHRLSRQAEQVSQQHDTLIKETRDREAEASLKERELEGQIATLRAQGNNMQAKIDEKQHELESLRTRRSIDTRTRPGALAMFVLSPGLTRGTDEPEKLIIPAAIRSIQLQLNLEREENYEGYVAEIRTARGNLVWSRSGLRSQRTAYGQAVSLTIQAELLSTGEYEIALKGAAPGKLEAIGYYYIIALKK